MRLVLFTVQYPNYHTTTKGVATTYNAVRGESFGKVESTYYVQCLTPRFPHSFDGRYHLWTPSEKMEHRLSYLCRGYFNVTLH